MQKDPNSDPETKGLEKVLAMIEKRLGSLKRKESGQDLSSLDSKMNSKLVGSGNEQLAKSLLKKASRANKKANGSKINQLMRSPYFIAGMSLFILIAGTATVGFLWNRNRGANIPLDTFRGLSRRDVTPYIAMQPTELTDSGFVSNNSAFQFEIDAVLRSDPKDVVRIEPKVEMTIESKVENGKTLISIKPDKPLSRGQNYTISMKAGTEYDETGQMIKDLVWVVPVEPRFAVIGTTPRDNTEQITLDSTIEIEFNHLNISEEDFDSYFSMNPSIGGSFRKVGTKIVFIPTKRFEVDTRYTVNISGEFSNSYGEKLGKDTSFSFVSGQHDSEGNSLRPSVMWMDHRDFISMTEEIILNTYSWDYSGDINYQIYDLGSYDIMDFVLGNINVRDTIADLEPFVNMSIPQEQSFRYETDKKGLVYVVARVPSGEIAKFVSLTSVSVLAGGIQEQIEGWVYDMNTAQAASGVIVIAYKEREPVKELTTDVNGYFKAGEVDMVLLKNGNEQSIWSPMLNAHSQSGDMFIYQRHLYNNPLNRNKLAIRMVSDKPLYLAGDEVKLVGLIRQQIEGNIVPPGKINEVTIRAQEGYYYDYYGYYSGFSDSNPLYEETVKVDKDFGTFDTSFKIPQSYKGEALWVIASVDGVQVGSSYVSVGEYSKPVTKYSASVVGSDKVFLGETVKVVIQGNDYSGNPLSNETVKVLVNRGKIEESSLLRYGEDYWGGAYNSGQFLEETIRLDANGYAEYMFTPYGTNDDSHYYRFRVNLNSADEAGLYLASTSVFAVDGPVDIEVSDRSYENILEGGDMEVEFASKGSWSRDLIPNKNFKATLTRSWTVRESVGQVYDSYYKKWREDYRYRTNFETFDPIEFQTDSNGKVSHTFTNLEYGSYSIRFEYDDISEVHNNVFYVRDGKYLDQDRVVEVTTSDRVAAVGDNLRVMINTSLEINGLMLINGQKAVESKTVSLTPDNSYTDTISIEDKHFPFIYVCFYGVIKDADLKGWGSSCSWVRVESDIGMLQVEVSTDKESYVPGEQVKVSVTTKDRKGKPVEAMVNLKAVDQALLDVTYKDLDTTKTLRDYFYNNLYVIRYYGTNGMFPVTVFEGGTGGGGGGDMREDFTETALWAPQVKTNKSGVAEVVFELPDGLTTWEVSAMTSTSDGQFGVGVKEIRSNLSRYVTLNTPKFVRMGDKVSMVALLGNFETSYSGTLEVSCEGCAESTQTKSFDSPKNSRSKVKLDIEPVQGADRLKLTAVLKDGESVIDQTSVTIPIYSDSVIGQMVQTAVIHEEMTEYVHEFEIDQFDPGKTSAQLTLSRTFAFEQFRYPADTSLLSTKNLSNAILHNTFILSRYEDLSPSASREEIIEITKEHLGYLRNNQADTGGFGWFDYDAVSLDSSVIAAKAYRSAQQQGIQVNSFVLDNMTSYFVFVMESPESSVHDKILAYDGLSISSPQIAKMYIYSILELYKSSEEARTSALTIGFLMDAFNNLGNTGGNKMLINDLMAISVENEEMLHWEDSESLYRVAEDPAYVTAVIYNSLYPLEEWNMKYMIRNWLLRQIQTSNLHSSVLNEIIYYIAVGDQDAVYFLQNEADIEVRVNGNKIRDYQLKEGSLNQRVVVNITSEHLQQGENTIRIQKTGDTELYSILTVEKPEVPSTEAFGPFKVTRSFVDLDSDRVYGNNPVRGNSLVRVRLEMTSDKAYKDVIIRDFIPTGFEPVNLHYGGVSLIARQKFYRYDNLSVNRWGNISRDYVTFVVGDAEPGKTYSFEYLAIAGSEGDLSGGGTHVYLNLLPEVQSFIQSPRVVVE